MLHGGLRIDIAGYSVKKFDSLSNQLSKDIHKSILKWLKYS